MRILLAPDSFKGSATALEVCQAMREGIQEVERDAEVILSPMADGGEGTVENLAAAYDGKLIDICVTGPAGKQVNAEYAILPSGVCIIEMAQAAGFTLLSEDERNPLRTTTYGVGQIIRDALGRGCRKFIIGLGGSATNDGGCGMAAALGYEFLDANGQEISFGGGSLSDLHEIKKENVDPRIKDVDFRVACDVRNPLCGINGASHVFGPQKGATEENVIVLDRNLSHLAEIIKRDLHKDVKDIPGAGAAGGLGAGTVAFLNARLQEGVKIISELLEVEEKIKNSDIVFTGEGKCDSQTLSGKAPFGIITLANRFDKPSVIIAGDVDPEMKNGCIEGVREIVGIKTEDMTLEYAKEHVLQLITDAAKASYTKFLNEKDQNS